jgi:hypothetical protein
VPFGRGGDGTDAGIQRARQIKKAFDPADRQSLAANRNDVQVELRGSSGNFSVAFSRNSQKGSVLLPTELVQVDKLVWRPDRKLLAVGWVNADVSMVAVIDTAHAMLFDHFLAHDPTFSPDNRYAMFIKFFPPMGLMELKAGSASAISRARPLRIAPCRRACREG